MRKICKRVREKWDVIKIAIFHRIGYDDGVLFTFIHFYTVQDLFLSYSRNTDFELETNNNIAFLRHLIDSCFIIFCFLVFNSKIIIQN